MSIDMSTLQDVYILEYYNSLDCPRSLTCWLLYKNREHDQLVTLEWLPENYGTLQDAADSLAATKFLSKAKFLSTTFDKRKIALEKFIEAENHCKETNRRISVRRFNNPLTEVVLSYAARKIDIVLGSFNAEEFVDSCNWGPGATTLIKRNNASSPLKFEIESRISRKAYDFVEPWFRAAYPNWDPKFEINGLAKIVTVPKDAKTDRTIAIEPGLNLWFQKGIGSMIRSRLKRVGIDLNDQSYNQEFARIGSKFNQLATIDFSSASDMISRRLVEEIIPYEWFQLLDTFRSCCGLFDENKVIYHKFSSMGNGYTFELESLIFYAVAFACCEVLKLEDRTLSVYGDDVVIPCKAVDLFASVTADLGFIVNKKKSYSNSYYRESCGEHFWNGSRIKPIFQKEPLNGKTQVLKSANSVRRYAHRRNNIGCDRRFLRCWQVLSDFLGTHVPKISDGYGDLGLVVNRDEAEPLIRAKHGYEGYHVRLWAPLAVNKLFSEHGLMLSKLKSIGRRRDFDVMKLLDPVGEGNEVPLPGRVRHAKVRVLIPRWHDLGDWV